MAAAILFSTLSRNARGCRRMSFRPFSSSTEAIIIHGEKNADGCGEEEKKDDLRSRIFRVRLPKRSATYVLQKWVNEGGEITVSELRNISRDLNRSHRYKHALEVSEWMVSHEEFQLSDSDYAFRVDLMTKVFGIEAAERYFERLPPSAKTCETYTALLHSYAGLKLIEKAEEFFKRMTEEANLSLSAITYNELMTLYMSVGHFEKVPQIIEEMKRQKIAYDLFTYNLLVSSCAASLNIDEVRRVLDEMSLDPGCNKSWLRYRKLADIYIISGRLTNLDANAVVESEKDITQRELISYDFLLILHGGLGNKDKLDQIWRSFSMTRQKLTGRNYVCVLSSYLILGHLKEVGEIIDQWKKSSTPSFNSSMCSKLLEAFKDVGLTEEAKSFQKLLGEKGCVLMDEIQ
ncbi:pentatricopeptide repeat-containing protein At5g09450, mitochondrial-like [Primulina huaijiensis]|uniref:pentatricopeptide repeat-containing protein At5g09450, mitochondrial-like n=1 Tax=Primulina huaijiensis TaxID=1492673 RepID=UPI003CC6EEC9